jgi:hypothetical protein
MFPPHPGSAFERDAAAHWLGLLGLVDRAHAALAEDLETAIAAAAFGGWGISSSGCIDNAYRAPDQPAFT